MASGPKKRGFMTPVTITIPSFTLNGWKTYVCAAALIGLSVAHNLGYISNDLYEILLPLLGGGGLAALRSAVTKSGPQPILEGIGNLVTAAIQMQPPTQPVETKPLALEVAARRAEATTSTADQAKEVQYRAINVPGGTTMAAAGNVGGNG
jgi:hypothetical protein